MTNMTVVGTNSAMPVTRTSNLETAITDIGWENKGQKNERNENENYYLLW